MGIKKRRVCSSHHFVCVLLKTNFCLYWTLNLSIHIAIKCSLFRHDMAFAVILIDSFHLKFIKFNWFSTPQPIIPSSRASHGDNAALRCMFCTVQLPRQAFSRTTAYLVCCRQAFSRTTAYLVCCRCGAHGLMDGYFVGSYISMSWDGHTVLQR